jgi:hypothetical protein
LPTIKQRASSVKAIGEQESQTIKPIQLAIDFLLFFLSRAYDNFFIINKLIRFINIISSAFIF